MATTATSLRIDPYVASDTAPFRTAVLAACLLGATGYVSSALYALALSASSPAETRNLVNRVLAEIGGAAPWLLPMFLSALIAGLAVALVPGWSGRHETRGKTSESDDLRLFVGYMCLAIAGLFFAWALWIVTAWAVPGLTPSPSGAGTLVGLLLVGVLATLGARASRGTLAQRYLDARRTRFRLLKRRKRTRAQTIFVGTRPARWPVRLMLLLSVLGIAALVPLTLLGRLSLSQAFTAFGTVIVFVLLPLALCIRSFSDLEIHQFTTNVVAGTAIAYAAVMTLVASGLDWVGVVAAAAVLSPVVATVPWRGKFLFASLGHAPLKKAIASNDEEIRTLRQHLEHQKNSPPL